MSHAHVTITEEDALYRRIPPDFWTNGRVSSAAFKVTEDQISVDLKRLTTVDQSLAPRKERNFGLAELSAGIPLHLGLEVSHDPIPANNAHSVIKGFEEIRDVPEMQIKRLLAEACTIIVKPGPQIKR